jgi:hypothetical protein
MFITSRASVLVCVSLTGCSSSLRRSGPANRFALYLQLRVLTSVPTLSQPENSLAHGGSLAFIGFLAGFLEMTLVMGA